MSRAGKVSLRELMGKEGGGKISLDKLPDLLGAAMPDMPRNLAGKNRLLNALKRMFCSSYRNLPGIKDLIKDFDGDVAFEEKVNQMKRIKVK